MNNQKTNSTLNKLQLLLKYTFTVVSIVAGADKFLNFLTDWTAYLSPATTGLLPFEASTFMMIVGVIEIIAGVLVFTRTREGAYLVAIWLTAIALSLLLSWHHPDVAVRDLVMALSAFVLAKLTEVTAVSEPAS